MKINTELGYVPVTFSDLTDDDAFWKGCEGCVNFDVLKRTNRRYCICTAMLYDPHKHDNDQKTEAAAEGEDKGFFASLVDLIKKSMNKKGK